VYQIAYDILENMTSLKGKMLFSLSALLAIYNLYEIHIVQVVKVPDNPNGYFDLTLPILLVLNLVWAIRSKKRLAYISLALCAVSITGAAIMLSNLNIETG
jgi:hypothetical protein